MQNQAETQATTNPDSNITQLNLSKAIQPRTKTFEELLEAITTMDSLSQSGFGHIRAIASLAKQAVKSSQHAYLDKREIADVFDAIRRIADVHMDSINCEAENCGANYVGE